MRGRRAEQPQGGDTVQSRSVSVQFLEKEIVVFLSGSIDAAAATLVREHLDIVCNRKTKMIVVDFHRADYVSSHAVAILAEARERLLQEGRDLLVRNVNDERTRLVFQLLRLEDYFSIDSTAVRDTA